MHRGIGTSDRQPGFSGEADLPDVERPRHEDPPRRHRPAFGKGPPGSRRGGATGSCSRSPPRDRGSSRPSCGRRAGCTPSPPDKAFRRSAPGSHPFRRGSMPGARPALLSPCASSRSPQRRASPGRPAGSPPPGRKAGPRAGPRLPGSAPRTRRPEGPSPPRPPPRSLPFCRPLPSSRRPPAGGTRCPVAARMRARRARSPDERSAVSSRSYTATTFFPPITAFASASAFPESTPHALSTPPFAAPSSRSRSASRSPPSVPVHRLSTAPAARIRRRTSASRIPDVPLRGFSQRVDERTRSIPLECTTTMAAPFRAARRSLMPSTGWVVPGSAPTTTTTSASSRSSRRQVEAVRPRKSSRSRRRPPRRITPKLPT